MSDTMSMFQKPNITARIKELALIGIPFPMDYLLLFLLLAQNGRRNSFSNFQFY